MQNFIEECAAFPNGAHDDQVDAMTQMLLRRDLVRVEIDPRAEEYIAELAAIDRQCIY